MLERLANNPEMSYAVIYHGDFKVIIPVLEAIEEPEDYRGQPRGDVLHYLLNKRLGAEVDYIVKGVDQENNVVAASRLEAMALKRRGIISVPTGTATIRSMKESVQRPGLSPLSGPASLLICSARSATSRCGNFPISGGWMPHSTISLASACWSRSWRWTAATAATPRVSASVKQAMENPYEKALKKYVVGNRCVGTVSMVDLNGVFVSLDGGVDCLCTYPKRGRPPRGARATVRILGINHENNRIWGVITYVYNSIMLLM